MCFGKFDFFHEGHRFFLKQSASFGDALYIIIARDKTIKKHQATFPRYDENERLQTIAKNFPTAKVLLGHHHDHYQIITEINPKIICLGYDQLANELEIQSKFPQVKIHRISSFHPEKYKSSLLKNNN
jgi:FAD synthetase